MKKFLLLYKGPATPPEASHEGWQQWFHKLGDNLVDRGSPMAYGRSLRGDGSTSDSATSLNGYSIIQAEERDEALRLLRDHPYLSLGNEYTVEIFDLGG
ncbi:MAG TPA: YciI family protein [Ktedonobacteraceae bacterium]